MATAVKDSDVSHTSSDEAAVPLPILMLGSILVAFIIVLCCRSEPRETFFVHTGGWTAVPQEAATVSLWRAIAAKHGEGVCQPPAEELDSVPAEEPDEAGSVPAEDPAAEAPVLRAQRAQGVAHNVSPSAVRDQSANRDAQRAKVLAARRTAPQGRSQSLRVRTCTRYLLSCVPPDPSRPRAPHSSIGPDFY